MRMRNIIYVTIPSVIIGVYLYYNYNTYFKDKYIKSFAYDKYKNNNNKIIEYHCVETYYKFYTEFKKYFYDENGEIIRVEFDYKYKF